jgi:predicted metalloendopeptidase
LFLAGFHCSLSWFPSVFGGCLFFNFGSDQDYENSQNVIAFAEAGGLGLPDRDYYTKTDQRSVDIRNKYLAHVQAMFELLGDKPDLARAAGLLLS